MDTPDSLASQDPGEVLRDREKAYQEWLEAVEATEAAWVKYQAARKRAARLGFPASKGDQNETNPPDSPHDRE